jgi:hypothetical protein
MAAVEKLCPRTLVLSDGNVHLDDDSGTAIRHYLGCDKQVMGQFNANRPHGSAKRVAIDDAWIEKGDVITSSLLFGDSPTVSMKLKVFEKTTFSVELILRQGDGIPIAFAPSGLAQDWILTAEAGMMTVLAHLPKLQLAMDDYTIDLAIADTGRGYFDYVESALGFTMQRSAIGSRNWQFSQRRGQGNVLWDVSFESSTITA